MSSRGRKGTVSIALIVMGFGILLIALMLTAAAHRVWEASLRVKEAARESGASLAVFVYDEDLCELLKGNVVHGQWRVAVINSGTEDLTLDYVAYELSGAKVGDSQPNKVLHGGEAWVARIPSSVCDSTICAQLRVHAHTSEGVYVVGGRAVPNPYPLTEVRGNSCQEKQ